jgi:hypothetical protein
VLCRADETTRHRGHAAAVLILSARTAQTPSISVADVSRTLEYGKVSEFCFIRCDLRCVYCMSGEHWRHRQRAARGPDHPRLSAPAQLLDGLRSLLARDDQGDCFARDRLR